MAISNPEILDAAKLVVDTNGEVYRSLTHAELASASAMLPNGHTRLLSGQVRQMSTYDPQQMLPVMAGEFMLTAHDSSESNIFEARLLYLAWIGQDSPCGIDVHTGEVFGLGYDDKDREIDLMKEPEWHTRILGALSALADSIFEV